MNPITTTEMLGAIDKGLYFYKKAVLNDIREVYERDRYTLAIKEVIDIVKIVRHYGGKDKVAELLEIKLNKQQPSLFTELEPIQDTIVTNFHEFVSEQNNRSASQTTP